MPSVAQHPLEIDYEVELAIVVGTAADGGPCRNVRAAEAMNFVAGFTVANDVSARRWQGKKGGGQWVRAKSFDGFCPLGPCLVPRSALGDAASVSLRSSLRRGADPELELQSASTANMVFSIADIVAFVSQGTTLLPRTVILTGTPSGVGYARDPPLFLQPGDTVDVEIDGIGLLQNRVVPPR